MMPELNVIIPVGTRGKSTNYRLSELAVCDFILLTVFFPCCQRGNLLCQTEKLHLCNCLPKWVDRDENQAILLNEISEDE